MTDTVSIIMPVRNEEKFIAKALDSLLENDYPKEKIEILIIDGKSSDKTKEIALRYAQKYKFIKVLDNPMKTVPYALNLGIYNAKGYYIVRVDGHSKYPKNYISQLITWHRRLNADNVGGRIKHTPPDNSLKSKAIAKIFESPFGVGDSKFRTASGNTPLEVDTVPYGTFKKTLFYKIGMFNEKLARNQDIEFNHRIRQNGGKIFLLPWLEITYYTKTNFWQLMKYAFKNSYWNILTVFYTKRFSSLSFRHFVPLFFVLGLIGLVILSFLHWGFVLGLIGILVSYFLIGWYFAGKQAESLLERLLILYGFFVFHLSYGIGEIAGILGVIVKFFGIDEKIYLC